MKTSGKGKTKTNQRVNQVFLSATRDGMNTVPGSVDIPVVKGDVLGKQYTILEKIDVGGFGSVYKVYDGILEVERALKIVIAAQGDDMENRAVERLLHEFKLRTHIDNVSHVIKSDDPRLCSFRGFLLVLMPMEFAADGNLRRWLTEHGDIKKRRRSGLKLFRQACLGIRAIHEVGLLHMDVKPENILLSNGRVKVTDLGIGRFIGSNFAQNPEQFLRQGIGTPQYMSPEQFQTARQKDIGPASDIYSLGLVLYEILDGGLPFDGSPDELKHKHLNVTPTKLKSASCEWWPVLAKCLAKAPGGRYANINLLLKDIDRVERGIALADVACKKCGHINTDANKRFCENCSKALPTAFFHPCPTCAKTVRLDVETCPGCGAGVAAHYLRLHRQEQVEQLKDEDPVEAVVFLETLLKDGAGDYHKRAQELIRELRQKQDHIADRTTRALKATASGALEKAIEAWREILSIVPRHRLAEEKLNELQSLLKRYRTGQSRATGLMAKARFDEAQKLLVKCVELIPTRAEGKDQLAECHRLDVRYSAAMTKAKKAHKAKRLREAMKHVKVALAVVPGSEQAAKLKAELSKSQDSVVELFRKAQTCLAKADCKGAEKRVGRIDEIQKDHADVNALKQELVKSYSAFERALENARESQASHDLTRAKREVSKALRLCPEAKTALTLRQKIDAARARARSLTKDIVTATQAADFEEAWAKVKQVEKVSRDLEALAAARDTLKKTQDQYERHMSNVSAAGDQGDLAKALKSARATLKLCPNSKNASEIVTGIERDRATARQLVEDVKEHFRRAAFGRAKAAISKARELWPLHVDLIDAEERLQSLKTAYAREMEDANKARQRRDYRYALVACNRLLDAFPDASDPRRLRKEVKAYQNAEKRRQEAQWRALAERELAKAAVRRRMWQAVGVVLMTVCLLGLASVLEPIVNNRQMTHRLKQREAFKATVAEMGRKVRNLDQLTDAERQLLAEALDGMPQESIKGFPTGEGRAFFAGLMRNVQLEKLIRDGRRAGFDVSEAEAFDRKLDTVVIANFEGFFAASVDMFEKIFDEAMAEKTENAPPNTNVVFRGDRWAPLYPSALDMTCSMTVTRAQDHELFSMLADELLRRARQGEHRIRDAAALKQFEEKVSALRRQKDASP